MIIEKNKLIKVSLLLEKGFLFINKQLVSKEDLVSFLDNLKGSLTHF